MKNDTAMILGLLLIFGGLLLAPVEAEIEGDLDAHFQISNSSELDNSDVSFDGFTGRIKVKGPAYMFFDYPWRDWS